MTMMTWLAAVLREAGCRVHEVPGWQERGRGEMTAVRGILVHHTAGPRMGNAPSLNLIVEGRKDLQGPLSQLVLGRDGTFFVVAAGRCNHAGIGAWQDVTAGNSSFIGIEAENTGMIDDPWPNVQMEALTVGCAAILKHIGADEVMVAGHREYALPRGRKIDPLFDMIDFREDVATLLDGDKPILAPPVILDPARLMLRKGDQGNSVRKLQSMLNAWIFDQGEVPVTVDGGFGKETDTAVRRFQKVRQLNVDGKVGPATWKALYAQP